MLVLPTPTHGGTVPNHGSSPGKLLSSNNFLQYVLDLLVRDHVTAVNKNMTHIHTRGKGKPTLREATRGLLKTHNFCASALNAKADYEHGLLSEPNG